MPDPTNNPQVDELALEYLGALEAGERPDLDAFTARLPDPVTRQELRDLVSTATWARAAFPTPFKSMTVVAGRYLLLDELGSGGFGKVWRAEDQQLKRMVAIKLFHPLLDDAQLESSLRRERQALARVTHEGIVRLLDSGKHENTHFLVMDCIKGRSLDRAIEQLAALPSGSRLDRSAAAAAIGTPAAGETGLIEDDWFRTAARITCQILWALAAAHSGGVVHRDLKPGNVMLRPGGRPVLLDFGLAGLREKTDGSLTARLFGTAAYVAPEQLANSYTGKDIRVDIYQCGLLLYEMLTLRRAFDDTKQTMLLDAVRQGRVTPPRNVRPDAPAQLADVCMRAIERDPARRYATADAFRDDLERWLAGELPRAARLGGIGRVVRSARGFARWHRAAILTVSIGLVGAGATAYAALRPPDITYQRVGDAEYAVTVRNEGCVFAWVHVLDESGNLQSLMPVQLSKPEQQPDWELTLASGTAQIRVQPAKFVGAGAKAEHRFVLATDQRAADVERFQRAAAKMAATQEGSLTPADVRSLYAEMRTRGKGDGLTGELPLEDLLRR